MVTAVLYWEEVTAIAVPIFKLQPPTKYGLGLFGEVNRSVFSALGYLRSQEDFSVVEGNVLIEQFATLSKSHTTVEHQVNHCIISVLGEVGFIESTYKFLEVFV